MSLSSSLSTAQSIFNNTATQTSVVSKNISNDGNTNYNRRSAVLSNTGSGAQVITTERAQNTALLRQTIVGTSQSSGQQTVLAGLEELKEIMGGNDYETAPSTYMAALSESIQAYASKPSDASLAASLISSAQDVATSLNDASASVQAIRLRADQQITSTVSDLNDLLSRFQVANDAVKSATATGGDPNDALDLRETLLKQISQIVGVSASTRDNNDMVLYTSDGITLFETLPRSVTFAPTNGYTAATTGKAVYIDGVAVDAGQGANTTASGSLAGLLQVRDEIAPVFQSQLDEIARGLITVFAETGADGTELPQAGLFSAATPDVPAAATLVGGLAAAIRVNPTAVETPSLLRDGGINGAAYVVNSSGSSYSTLLQSYVTGLQGSMEFDPATGIDPNTSVLSFGTNSVGWLEELRSSASSADETKTAALSRSTEAYSNITGVNLDEELSLLLDVEQSYKAAAKLLSTIDEMLQSLLDVAS